MLRKLTTDDFLKSVELSQYAFQYTLSEEELKNAKKNFDNADVWGIFAGERLLSKLNILHFNVWIAGRQWKMGGIAGVATWPEERRGGSVKSLLTKALEEMRSNGESISFLHPFKVSFYRKFGWEVMNTLKKYEIEHHQLTFLKETNGHVKRLQKETFIEDIQEIYEQFGTASNGMLKRSKDRWEKTVGKGYQAALYYNEQGSPRGYMIYKVEKKEMCVDEWIVLDYEARKGLWNFICQHDSMIKKVIIYHQQQSDQLPFLSHYPEMKQEENVFGMGRIVDVALFAADYPFAAKEQALHIHICDETASWNQGVLTIANGKTTFKEGASLGEGEGLSLSIQTLTALLIGYQTPAFLYEVGKIEGNEAHLELLQQLLPDSLQKGTYLIDFF
ncbi:GNAT family N-acetyltransferase [Bacillus chungangensis]|uniref:Acetyltransferase n=1 Tax=Bacillus chungangensis TaxID=587633 RepID=A0ABT9WXB7_9BACI|nr:GNAT family N-acetyltransferase [Bacillus chungangensis]MDQ0177940.1 putative acetyltransferase [Bacillus chungangensis]